ncbi:MAG: FG-GAP repeat protein [Polyangiales bacterium]
MRTPLPIWFSALLLAAGTATSAHALPLTLPQTKLLAPDGSANDHFGMAVAVSGDTAVIGAEGDSSKHGAAYVYLRNGQSWTLQQKLVAADGANGDEFGHAVAIDGNTVVVGAYGDDDNADLSGSAYVFVRSGTTWTQQQKLLATGGFAGDEFGASVAISGDTALIGAFLRDDNGTSSGAAYVLTRSGATFTQQQKLLASDGVANDEFGASVALQGDTALIGAFGSSDHGTSSGAAYVFARSAGVFAQAQKLVPADGASHEFFGNAVALYGNTAVIGAFQDDDGANNAGSAYVFTRSAGSFSFTDKLLAADPKADDSFGYSVAVGRSFALVGAYQHDDNGADSGAVYLFERGGDSFPSQQKILASDGSASNWFGWSVAIDDSAGAAVIVGAYGDDDKGSFSGSSYAFTQAAPLPVPALGAGRALGLGLLLLSVALLAMRPLARRAPRRGS